MRYLLILILFSSCSTTFTVNGHRVKQKTNPVNKQEFPIYIAAFIFGYSFVAQK